MCRVATFFKFCSRKKAQIGLKINCEFTEMFREGPTSERRRERGDRRQEKGGGREETGDRRQEAGDRRQETGGGRREVRKFWIFGVGFWMKKSGESRVDLGGGSGIMGVEEVSCEG